MPLGQLCLRSSRSWFLQLSRTRGLRKLANNGGVDVNFENEDVEIGCSILARLESSTGAPSLSPWVESRQDPPPSGFPNAGNLLFITPDDRHFGPSDWGRFAEHSLAWLSRTRLASLALNPFLPANSRSHWMSGRADAGEGKQALQRIPRPQGEVEQTLIAPNARFFQRCGGGGGRGTGTSGGYFAAGESNPTLEWESFDGVKGLPALNCV
ncbi:uncharacterized protein BJX67DRAFT_129630 [Aspergillus lucknowensis]|uniref:Uncharacterized protein n=1 Tax=Aspergillus lucknowensis TaxID=176173 RepID=A0ABR4LQ14_9EURO